MPNTLLTATIELILAGIALVLTLLVCKEYRSMEKQLDDYHTNDTTFVYYQDTLSNTLIISR